MKKIIAIMLALVLALSFAACTAEKPAEEPTEPETPVEEPTEEPTEEPAEEPVGDVVGGPETVPDFTEYESLEALNEAMLSHFVKPGVMGVSDEYFMTINENKDDQVTIGEYQFLVNGVKYVMRVAGTTEDITGIYGENGTVFAEAETDVTYAETADCKVTRMFNVDGQYTLAVMDPTMDKDQFLGIADEIFSAISAGLDQEG